MTVFLCAVPGTAGRLGALLVRRLTICAHAVCDTLQKVVGEGHYLIIRTSTTARILSWMLQRIRDAMVLIEASSFFIWSH